MTKDQYVLVKEEEEEVGVDTGMDWSSSSEILPTNAKFMVIYLSLLAISLSANIILLLYHPPKVCPQDLGKTAYSERPLLKIGNHAYKIGEITFDTPIAYHSFSEYWNSTLNHSVMDEAWDALDTNPMAIALHDDYAEKTGLAPSTRFPWDTERSVYYLKGFHDLHCLVCHIWRTRTIC